MTVPSTLSEWLKSPELMSSVTNSLTATNWGERAIETEIRSPLAGADDAVTECDRQLDFLGPPRALEKIRLPGQRADLLGQSRTIVADRAGYETGIVVFVIGVEELEDDDATIITVVRRMT